MVGMQYEVKRIVHSDTDDDRANAQHYQRHIATHDRYEAHGEKPAKDDGHSDEQQVLHLAEGEYEE